MGTENSATLDATSGRGFEHGIEYYGTFMRALYTLFQVMTGESWSEAIARPLLFGWSTNNAVVVGVFFVSFIMLTQLVLINVVVAVLLEKFVVGGQADEMDENAQVDARLATLDPREASNDINAKLDQIMTDLSSLKHTVADLKAEMHESAHVKGDEWKRSTEQRNGSHLLRPVNL